MVMLGTVLSVFHELTCLVITVLPGRYDYDQPYIERKVVEAQRG